MTKNMPEGLRTTLGWVLGIAIIAFILLIMAIIFGNLSGNTGFDQESTSFINETITFTDGQGSIPATAQNRSNGAITSVSITNATGGEPVPSTNYTTSGVYIISTGSTSPYNGSSVNVTATVSYDGVGERNTQSVITNYTSSAVNTSTQLPTVGTIIGVAILLLILIGLLIFAIRKMMGVTGVASSNVMTSRSKFKGSYRGFS